MLKFNGRTGRGKSNRMGLPKSQRKCKVRFSELTEKGRSLRTKVFLRERNRKRKSYIPTSLLTESEQAKRWKESREKSMRFRERLRRNKENPQTPSTAGSVDNADDDSSHVPLVVKLVSTGARRHRAGNRSAEGSPGPIKR